MHSSLRHGLLALASCFSILVTASANASTFKVIHTFQNNGDNADGAMPEGQLILDTKGNLYGTTMIGGAYGHGAVFELSMNPDGSWSESILYSFTGGTDGDIPLAGLVFDSAGNLYGTTFYGGITNRPCYRHASCGVVFELSPSAKGWIYTLLHSFTGYGGAWPAGTLVLDADGNLYGTTEGGDFSQDIFCFEGCGVVFELIRADNWREKILHRFFETRADGADPIGGLVFDSSGNLYGITPAWGLYFGEGTVYELAPTPKGPWTETILYAFCLTNCNDGAVPTGGVVLHDGAIYGATAGGGANRGQGTVFKLVETTRGWRPIVFSFDGSDGEAPIAPVLLRNRKIIGVAQEGGIKNGACARYPDGNGVVYEVGLENGMRNEKVLYRFTGGNDGCGPSTGLISDADGNLYGTTDQGGSAGFGVVFEITP